MENIKILHCADMHLDAPLSGLPKKLAGERQDELRQTFGKMIDVAKKENVDIFLISGDLFDHERVQKTTIDYLVNKINEIVDIPVFIAAGNHDSLSKSYYYNKKIWPRNVHIFSSEISHIDLPELNCCIYGKSFIKPWEEENALRGFTVYDKSKINIMVLHAEITSAGSQSQYNPITLEDIKNSGLDYLALGHVHSFSGINKEGQTYWCYPGTPEGKGFDEMGEKGCVLGSVSKNYQQLDFVNVGKRAYKEVEADVTGFSTYEEIAEKVKCEMDDDSKHHFYKVVLKGDVEEDFNIHVDILQNRLKDHVYMIKIIDKTGFSIQLDEELSEDTLKNVFINNIKKDIQKALDKDEEEMRKRALKIGLCALKGERIEFNEDY